MAISKLKAELIKYHTAIRHDAEPANKEKIESLKLRLYGKKILDTREFVEKIDNYLLQFYLTFPEILAADKDQRKFFPLGQQLSKIDKKYSKNSATKHKHSHKTRRS